MIGRREQITLLSIAVILIGGLLLLAFAPLRGTITADDHNAALTFTAPGFTLLPDDCYTVTWQTEGIREIFLNGDPVIGEGEAEVCAGAAFRVGFPNGAEETYTVAPTILTRSIWFYGLAGLALIFILAAVIPRNVSGRVVRVVEIAVIWLVIMAVLLEGGTRLLVAFTGDEQDRLIYLGSPSEIAAASRTFIPMPFVNFGLNPAQPDINELGYRNESFPLDKPDDEIRIVAMGGSTTYGWRLEAAEAYPAQLERLLRDEYGYENVRLINAGVPSYTTWHTLVNFQFRVLELDPDLVLVYHAVNDGGAQVYTSTDCWRGQNLNVGLGASPTIAFTEPDLPASAFQRYVGIRLGLIPNPAVLGGLGEAPRQDNSFDCERAAYYGAQAYNNPPDYTERNLISLAATAQAHDVPLVFSTWASRWSQEPDSTGNPGYTVTFELNEVMRAVAAEWDVPLIDLERELPLNLDYWQDDEAHQTASGSIAQAEIYAAFLVAERLLPD